MTSTTREFWIATHAVATSRKRVKKLNERAAKLGAAPLYLTVTDETKQVDVATGDAPPLMMSATKVILTGEAPKMAGWEFIGHADASEGVPPIFTGEGKAFGADPLRCDHCQVKVRRVSTFAVRHDDGDVKVVGSTCVKDFTGHDPRAALVFLRLMHGEGAEDELSGSPRGPLTVPIEHFVAAAIAVERVHGWAPRSKAAPGQATADLTLDVCGMNGERVRVTFLEAHRGYEVTEADTAEAASALAWVRDLDTDRANDYLFNLAMACERDFVGPKSAGLAASLHRAFRSEKRWQTKQAAAHAETGPAPEGRTEVEGVITKIDTRQNGYGIRTVMTAELTGTGARVWGTLPAAVSDAKVGDTVRFTATFKQAPDDETFAFFKSPKSAEKVAA